MIKAVLATRRGVIPKHLHFHDPNPAIDWDRLPLQVTTDLTEWPRRNGRPRLAGVNSFGISGTNAHIVLEEYVSPDTAPGKQYQAAGCAQMSAVSLPADVAQLPLPEQEMGPRKIRFLPLSAKSEYALRELAGRYLSWLGEPAGEMAGEMGGTAPYRNPCWRTWRGLRARDAAISNTAQVLLSTMPDPCRNGSENWPKPVRWPSPGR